MIGDRDEERFSDRQQRLAREFEQGAYIRRELESQSTEVEETDSVLDLPVIRRGEEYRQIMEEQFFRDALGYNPMRNEFKIPGTLEFGLQDDEIIVNYSITDQNNRFLEHSENILDQALDIEQVDASHFNWEITRTQEGYEARAAYTEGSEPARDEVLERLETAVEILSGEKIERRPRYIN